MSLYWVAFTVCNVFRFHPSLFVGDLKAAQDESLLKRLKITGILNASGRKIKSTPTVIVKTFPINDDQDVKIIKAFEKHQVYETLDRWLNVENIRVLVNCRSGRNR